MNWGAIQALASIFGAACTIGSVFYFVGKFTERLTDHGRRLDDHGVELNSHTKQINQHEVEIGKINAWREGYNAAASVKHDS